ncbi:MAG TPA: LTA synthase family protein [Bacteroidales bacterium]|nr:LTA synthase family protein [Bacteroidales bacterium]HSA42711.1 LTA synthase family protein [Bacteroidales bacterium]
MVNAYVHQQWITKVFNCFHLFLIACYSLIVSGEAGIYPEWKSKLDYKALHYLRRPDEIARSSSTGDVVLLLALTAVLTLAGLFLWRRLVGKNLTFTKPRLLSLPVMLMLVPLFLFTGIRGGWRPIPINQSDAYFSDHNIVNLLSVNPLYNLGFSFLESRRYMSVNPFDFYSPQEAGATVEKLHAVSRDSTEVVLTNDRPNIVLLILESWSADLVESLGGEAGITPEFRELEKEGILFTEFYANGNRSQQGMAAIYGGFPSIPYTAITAHYAKFVRLPSLVKELKNAGYYTSFSFGGQLTYGGLRAYMMYNGFDRIMEEKDYPASIPRGKLGIHDQYTMAQLLEELKTAPRPFFSSLFTLSSHSPYDQPMEKVLDWGGKENQYLNSAWYTDHCLGDFFREARKQDWYANTLFIIVADHSHNTYRNYWVDTPPYRHIPLLLAGEVIRPAIRGRQLCRISSQVDLAASLLAQLKLDHSAFRWSKNLFNPFQEEFAYFEIEVGCGWIRKDGSLVYRKTSDQFELQRFPAETRDIRKKEALSYLQEVFQEFIDY